MTSLTDSSKLHASQHIDSAERHLSELRALIGTGDPAAGEPLESDNESVVAEAFGRWVLDILNLGQASPSHAVATARAQLVAVLSKQDGRSLPVEQPVDDYDPNFVDLFVGDDLEDTPDEELGVKPISYAV